jgi:nucleoid-associated protein Lsr2
MAQKVQVILVDDIDGGAADETVSFAVDGTSYEIDLSKKNAAQLRDALAPWVGSARKASGSRSRRSRSGRTNDSADVRAWAKGKGLAVSERGRISADIRAKYDAAH